MGLHKLNYVSNSLVIVTASPEEGRVHESSKHTDGRRGEISFWSRHYCAAGWIAKIMTSLSSIVAGYRKGKDQLEQKIVGVDERSILQSGSCIVSSQFVIYTSNSCSTCKTGELLHWLTTLTEEGRGKRVRERVMMCSIFTKIGLTSPTK